MKKTFFLQYVGFQSCRIAKQKSVLARSEADLVINIYTVYIIQGSKGNLYPCYKPTFHGQNLTDKFPFQESC